MDDSKEAAICPFCNTPYIVEKAINNYITTITNNIQAQNVTIVGGKDFNQIFNAAKALLGVSLQKGIETCEEALSLQPDNYEVWVLRAKYKIISAASTKDSVLKINELTPKDRISEVSKDLISFAISRISQDTLSEGYQRLVDTYFELDKLSPEDSVTMATEILNTITNSKLYYNGNTYQKLNMQQLSEKVEEKRCKDFEKCSAEFSNSYDEKDTIKSEAKKLDREFLMDKSNPAKSPRFLISSNGELKKVQIPDKSSCTTINIPESVVSVSSDAFLSFSCSGIKTIIFENRNEIRIDCDAFINCSSLTEIIGNVRPVEMRMINGQMYSQPVKGFTGLSTEFYNKNPKLNPQKKGCYVATCVYGSYDCPQVWTLRRYRDNTLGSTWYGRLFIKLYYAISPTLVKWFGKTSWFKKLWQGKLDRMVKKLNAEGVENTPYQDKQW
ncbi:MAG: hypothetical protein J5832_01700 [Clostridia bacterium]|nr:hypothetical protein [Clostridia bacterium]